MKLECAACGQTYVYNHKTAGQSFPCSYCHTNIVMPEFARLPADDQETYRRELAALTAKEEQARRRQEAAAQAAADAQRRQQEQAQQREALAAHPPQQTLAHRAEEAAASVNPFLFAGTAHYGIGPQRYPALRTIAVITRTFTWLALGLMALVLLATIVIGMFKLVDGSLPWYLNLAGMLLSIIITCLWSVLIALVGFGSAEAIVVLLDIADDLHASRQLLQEQAET